MLSVLLSLLLRGSRPAGHSPGAQEVPPLVLRVGLDRLENEIGHELLAEVLDVDLGRPAVRSLLGDGLVVFPLLPHVGAVAGGKGGGGGRAERRAGKSGNKRRKKKRRLRLLVLIG